MKYILYVVNLILATVLVLIVVYPQFKARQVQEIQIVAYPNLASFPVFVAKEKGFFDELKLNVMSEFDVSREDPLEDLRKGRFEVLAGYPVVNFLFEGAVDADKFRLMAMVVEDEDYPLTGVVVKTKSKRLSLKLLNKKSLAIPSWRKDVELFKKWLNLNKIILDEKKIIRYNTSVPYGEWDAAYVIEPMLSFLADSNDFKILMKTLFDDISSPYPYAGYFVSQTGVYFKRESVRRFHQAYDMAVDFIQDPANAEELKALLEKYEQEVLNLKEFIDVNLPVYLKKEQIQDIPVKKLYKWMRDNELSFYENDISPIFGRVP